MCSVFLPARLSKPTVNWLAHLFLSEPTLDVQLGNLIADILNGKTWDGISADTRAGISLHYDIDAFTDRHAVFKRSKKRLGQHGHLRGVVIDLTYDHMLSIHWHRFARIGLRDFLNDFYAKAPLAIGEYPDNVRDFIDAIIAYDPLSTYADMGGLESAMRRIDRRLSETVLRKESTVGYLPNVLEEYPNLEADFLEFFPALQHYVLTKTKKSTPHHWR